jgi:hypothetical protein
LPNHNVALPQVTSVLISFLVYSLIQASSNFFAVFKHFVAALHKAVRKERFGLSHLSTSYQISYHGWRFWQFHHFARKEGF